MIVTPINVNTNTTLNRIKNLTLLFDNEISFVIANTVKYIIIEGINPIFMIFLSIINISK